MCLYHFESWIILPMWRHAFDLHYSHLIGACLISVRVWFCLWRVPRGRRPWLWFSTAILSPRYPCDEHMYDDEWGVLWPIERPFLYQVLSRKRAINSFEMRCTIRHVCSSCLILLASPASAGTLPGAASAVFASSPGEVCCFRLFFFSKLLFLSQVSIRTYRCISVLRVNM